MLLAIACNLERIEPGANATKFSTTVGGNANDFPNDIIAAPDGGYVVVGFSQSFGNGNQAYIVKLNKDGGQEWDNNFGGTLDDYAVAVTAASDGGFVFCGRSTNMIFQSDVFIVKVNAQGNKVWEKNYGAADSSEVAFGIVPASGGDFLIGYVNSASGGDIVRLLRINTNGSKVSETTVRTGSYGMSDMIKTSDGKIVMVGSEFGNSTASYLLKLNENGSFVWENRFPMNPSNNYTPGFGVVELPDKSLVLAGSDLGTNTSDHDFNLVAYNDIGGHRWTNTFGGASADELYDVALSADNEIVVMGYSSSFSGTTEIYLSKRKASDGSKIWEQNFVPIGNSWGALAACADGGFIVCSAQNQANADIIIVKTDKDGNYQ